MARCEKIFIAGFSGSGKSGLLKTLKEQGSKDWKYHDLDQIILQNHPEFEQIKELIEVLGWEKFRLLEREGIEKFLKEKEKGIMALGGGAFNELLWQNYGNHPKIMFCYLYSSFEDCWERLNRDTQELRPLALKGKEDLRAIYEARLATYKLIPWKIDNNNGVTLHELAQKFWDRIQ